MVCVWENIKAGASASIITEQPGHVTAVSCARLALTAAFVIAVE